MADETDAMEKEDDEAVFRWVKKGKKKKKNPLKVPLECQKACRLGAFYFYNKV